MGDWFESVVDPIATAGSAPSLADAVVAELAAVGLITPVLSDCALGSDGYPPGPGLGRYLKTADDLLMELRTNGVAVGSTRAVHVSTEVDRIGCPVCGAWTGDLDGMSWQDAVGSWYEGGAGLLRCPSCSSDTSVAKWSHQPPCGFGYLAFTFWNWPPMTPEYWHETPVDIIERVTGHSCVVVRGKL